MNREDLINQKAEEYGRMKTADSDMAVAFADAFRRGANWADENPDVDAIAKC